MSTVETREHNGGEVTRPSWMDRMFDEWVKAFPPALNFGLRWPFHPDEMIRVDEFRDGDVHVVRADLPGIDPDKDVEITVDQGLLHIAAERRLEKDFTDMGMRRHEIRYGSLTRSLPLPAGATPADIEATYRDGILEIRVPVVRPAVTAEPTRVSVTKG